MKRIMWLFLLACGALLASGLVVGGLAAGGGVGRAIRSSKKTRLPCEGGTEPVEGHL